MIGETVQELAPGVFVATGFRRVNVGAVLTDDGFVLIDTPPYPDDALAWREQLAAISPKPVVAIVNTDCHRDRVLGNGWFEPRVIAAHEETITALRSLPAAFLDSAIDMLAASTSERAEFAGMRLLLPSVGFSQRLQLRYGGRVVQLLSMPGPTPGSLWVHLPEQRILFAGDSVVVDRHLHISNPVTKRWLDNLTELRRTRFAVDVIVCGRGRLADKGATEPISQYLRVARRRVLSVFNAGRPRADTSALVPELIELFPFDYDDAEEVQRRVKAGLERIYEEFKLGDRNNDTNNR
jgi:glyoxylase-like metal-dependent hydrolase (beta-lactamase superfamily II)